MKKLVCILLSLLIVAASLRGLAETTKHETVFAVTDAAGHALTVIDSVHLDNADALDVINDRTRLSGIENMSGSETFVLNGEELTWNANGASIRYQGQGDAAPAVVPAVSYRLDGVDTAAGNIKNSTGHLEMTVSFILNSDAPCFAACVLPVPDGVSNIELENAWLIETDALRLIVSAAVPGADEALGLPASFSMTCDADHADPEWMLTAASQTPLAVMEQLCSEYAADTDWQTGLDDLTALLTALEKNTAIPETEGSLKDISDMLRTLLDGTKAIRSGAQQLNTGLNMFKIGFGTLDTGLTNLTANNETLTNGAGEMFAALVKAADLQLRAAGLDAFGIEVSELTCDNYAAVMTGVIDTLKAAEGNETAAAAAQQMTALKEQLDAGAAFTAGLASYTAGVSKIAASTSNLKGSVDTLADGSKQLSDGTAQLDKSLRSGFMDAAGKALPYLEGDVKTYLTAVSDMISRSAGITGYDLAAEGMGFDTVYIIRTQLDR